MIKCWVNYKLSESFYGYISLILVRFFLLVEGFFSLPALSALVCGSLSESSLLFSLISSSSSFCLLKLQVAFALIYFVSNFSLTNYSPFFSNSLTLHVIDEKMAVIKLSLTIGRDFS